MKIKINPKRILSEVSPMIYGHFIEHFHRQIYGGIYAPENSLSDEDGFRTDVLDAMKQIRVPVIRWPGGCFVSAYHWKNAVGKDRKPMFDKAWRVEDPNTFGTDEYIKLCRKLGCEPYICTNAGTGTAEEMSDWVEYCNLKGQGYYSRLRAENGFDEPYNVKYWSIGNENYGDWEIGAKTAKEWGRFVTESAKMMKRTYPAIELSAAALADMDWNMELLKNCGNRLSWISLHGYWDFHNGKNELADYNKCMAYTMNLDAPILKVKGIMAVLGLEHIKIAYDEWNLRAWYHPNISGLYQGLTPEEYLYPRNDNDINSQYTMADAVFTACFLNMCIRNSDIIGMANFAPTVNTRGMIYTYDDGIVLRSTYHVFDAYVNDMEKNYVDMWDIKKSDKFKVTMNGNREVEVDTIDIVVTSNETGSKMSAAIVNKHPNEDRNINLSVDGLCGGRYKIVSVNGPKVDSYNDVGKTEIIKSESDWKQIEAGEININVASHSVNIVKFELCSL